MTMLSNHDPLTEKDHQRIARFIEDAAGIQLPLSKRSLIEGRLRKRQRAQGLSTITDYVSFVLDDPRGESEHSQMVDALTTNKTDFYREPEHFQFLRRYVAEQLAPKRNVGWRRPLRIWSAGCSSGEEPWTLAIELLEMQSEFPGFRFDILATDISESCLRHAKRGIYNHQRIEPVPKPLRRRHLMLSADRKMVQIAPEVRPAVRFSKFNLICDSYEFQHPFDAVFCRNVMIYFNSADREKIIQNYHRVLEPGGHLFIGHSESLSNLKHTFKQVIPTVYQK